MVKEQRVLVIPFLLGPFHNVFWPIRTATDSRLCLLQVFYWVCGQLLFSPKDPGHLAYLLCRGAVNNEDHRIPLADLGCVEKTTDQPGGHRCGIGARFDPQTPWSLFQARKNIGYRRPTAKTSGEFWDKFQDGNYSFSKTTQNKPNHRICERNVRHTLWPAHWNISSPMALHTINNHQTTFKPPYHCISLHIIAKA